jgi:AcrR family transcriptional regulator
VSNPDVADPRILRNRDAVHSAALRLLRTDGVGGLSVDRIADESGVSRSTIYRHWPDIAVLIVSAFDRVVHDDGKRGPLTGDTGVDLLTYLTDYARRLNDPVYSAVLIAIIEWSWRDPSFADVHARTFADSRSRAAGLLAAGVGSGALRADLDIGQGVEDLVAPFLYRRLILHRTITKRDIQTLHHRLMSVLGPDLDSCSGAGEGQTQ